MSSDKQPDPFPDRVAILMLGADESTAALLSLCLGELGVKLCVRSKGAALGKAVKRMKECRIGIIPGAQENAETLAAEIRSAGCKQLKFIWCLCDSSPELEAFFPRQPSEEVLVIDPGFFRKNPAAGCEQLHAFCEIGDAAALARAQTAVAQS